MPPRPALDYTDPSSWAARPGKDSCAELVPRGEERVPEEDRQVDCFYVHPTGYFGGASWNSPVPDPQSDEQTAFWLAGQASAFNEVCRVWSPE